MQDLSSEAAAILASMEPNRAYEAADLQTLIPDTSVDGLREIMHELWVNRFIERVGYTGWRRQASTCVSQYAPDPRNCASCPIVGSCVDGIRQTARLEQLLDQPAFAGLFK